MSGFAAVAPLVAVLPKAVCGAICCECLCARLALKLPLDFHDIGMLG